MRRILMASTMCAAVAAAVLGGGAAYADGTSDLCNTRVALITSPRVDVSHQDTQVLFSTSYTGGCISSIRWDWIRTEDGVNHGNTLVTRDGDSGTYTASLDDSDQPGHYLLTNATVRMWDYMTTAPMTDIATLDVRYHGRVTKPSAHRTGGSLTLSALATHYHIKDFQYSASEVGYVRWGKARVTFEKLVGSEWVPVKSVRASKKGVATAVVKSGRGKFRAVVADASVAWGATSSVVTK